jgi:periplasmic protein TonB
VPDNMFRDVVDPSIKVGSTRGYTIPCSIVVHTLVVVAVIVFPLAVTNVDSWPTPPTLLAFVGAPPLPQPPPAPAPPRAQADKPQPPANADAAPIEAPREITLETPSQSERSWPGVIEGTGTSEILGGVGERAAPPPPPPPPPAPPVTPRAPVPVGGDIRPPAKTKDVPLKYPPIAQAAQVQGIVIIEATISPTGKVQNATVLRSIPLLDAAALEAVRQWEYTPTLLNGVPVAVVMTVTVNFQLR